MIEFNKKDKNGRNILVNIITEDGGDVRINLYAEESKKFLFVKWTKMVKLKTDCKYIGQINKWVFRDYEKWADDQIYLLNCWIRREEEKNRTAEKIERGKF